jgi:tetratricopeptide (TPR) repeat protein
MPTVWSCEIASECRFVVHCPRLRLSTVRARVPGRTDRSVIWFRKSGDRNTRPRSTDRPLKGISVRFILSVSWCWCAAVTLAQSAPACDYSQALSLYKSHHYADARNCFASLAVEQPNDSAVNFYLGRLAWWFDEDDVSVAYLERAAKNSPGDARVQNALGDTYGLKALNVGLFAKFGWAKKCLAAHLLAVQLAPNNVSCRWGLLGYYCLAPGFAGGGYDKALAQAAVIRALDPMGGRIAFATIYLAQKKNDAAFAEFDAGTRGAADDFIVLFQVGRCAALSGEQLDRGSAALRKCLTLTPPEGDEMPTSASVHFRLGNILEKKSKKAAAEAEYALATRDEPDFRPEKVALRN